MRLRAADLEGVLRFVDDANNLATDEQPFPEDTLTALAELVPCEGLGAFEVDRVRRRSYPLDGEQDEQWWAVSHQHPICKYVEESGDFRALKVSDFLTRTQLHRLELHDHLGFDYEMMLPLRSPPWHERGFSLVRAHRDFSERDRTILDLLAPHLLRLIRNLELRRRLSIALAALDAGDVDQGVVLLDPNARVDHATPHARSLLAKYFPSMGAPLPEAVTKWLADSTQSLVQERGTRRLVVDRVGQSLLAREEPIETTKVATLTPREQQVLQWVAQGRTNSEIAAILVTAPGTVRKHLENIYAKLGVHTRTAAAAYAPTQLAAAA